MAKGKVKKAKRETKDVELDVETLGGRLRAYRLEMGETVEEFSSDGMIPENDLVAIENNSIEPTIKQLFELAVGTDIDLHYLLTGRPSDLYCRCYIVYPKHSIVTIHQKE